MQLLSCRYTEAGLKGLVTLKNRDRVVGAILQSLAADGQLEVHLCFVKRHEQGPAEGCPGDWSLYEVHEAENKAYGLITLDGSEAGCRSMSFGLHEILNPQARLVASRSRFTAVA